jgi:hypothetical protein
LFGQGFNSPYLHKFSIKVNERWEIMFIQIRNELMARGLVPKTCREVGPYYYSQNGGTKRERSAGHVANVVRRMVWDAACKQANLTPDEVAEISAPFADNYPCESWCGKWPRTQKSLQAEAQGEKNFWEMANFLIQSGLLLTES